MSEWNFDRWECERVAFETLIGKTLKAIHGDKSSDELIFETADGEAFKMYHSQDCCERVALDDVGGELSDLIGTPILLAEKVIGEPPPEVQAKREKEEAEAKASGDYYYREESETWTYYKIATVKGSVALRWWGSSNGYYSESVDFIKAKP